MTEIQMVELENLFYEWVNAAGSVIGERSGNIARDMVTMLSQAKRRAEILGIKWPAEYEIDLQNETHILHDLEKDGCSGVQEY